MLFRSRVSLSSNVLAAERGVVQKYMADDGEITLEALIVDPSQRGKGAAKSALDLVTKLADSQGRTLYLEPVQLEENAGLTRDQLVRLYSQYGFKSADRSGSVMVREPGAKPGIFALEKEIKPVDTNSAAFKRWFGVTPRQLRH